MTDQAAPSNDEILTQVDFTTEELSVLLRVIGATLPQFQPLDLTDEAREATLRALYARGIITADADGQFSVNGGAALLVSAGVQARLIAQLDRPVQQIHDILYLLDGLVLRQTEPMAGIQRFQILDTPFKLVSLFSAALNIDPDHLTAPDGDAVTLTRAEWTALRDAPPSQRAEPESLWRALALPNAVVAMTSVTIYDGQPQAPQDLLMLGHPDGGYWSVIFQGDDVTARPLDSVGAVQELVNLLG